MMIMTVSRILIISQHKQRRLGTPLLTLWMRKKLLQQAHPPNQCPIRRREEEKNVLKTISLAELEDSPDLTSPLSQNKGRRIWKYEDIDYFKTLFTDKMIEHIAHHTNLYSAQELEDPIKTSPDEIEDFLAVLLFMGVFTFPAIEDYWHHKPRFNVIADIMPRKRFTLLRRFIHFKDNQQCNASPDRFYKIRPLFEMLREQCLLIPSTYKHSVDEVMVGYKGTRAGPLHQYIANKPDKWGFKLFCRASSCGIIYDLLLYQGASTFFSVTLSEQEQVLPLGAKLVTALCKTIALPQLSVVFCDNYFINFNLVQSLHATLGIKCIGTVQPNRMSGALLMTDKELMKKGRGAFDYRSAEGVITVKWFDNKCINLLSNVCGIEPLSTVKRWSKEAHTKINIPCPSLIPAYNDHVGGIDLSDMLVHLYKTPAKSRRWYIPLDCGLLNEKPITQKVSSGSRTQFEPSQKKRYTPRPSRPQPDVQYDNCGHLPLHCDKRGWCNLCPKGVSRWKCQKCMVFLCLNANQQCFVVYHQK
uniref:PiggyBac transposable element-derived protein domain-containing protein n=1 Tax=Amphiprion percula TaxID=161767 RepID=A0A3P8S7U4_AMPPE